MAFERNSFDLLKFCPSYLRKSLTALKTSKRRLRAVSRLLLNPKKRRNRRGPRAGDQRESGEAAIAASPLSALVDRAAFFGSNSKQETVRSRKQTMQQRQKNKKTKKQKKKTLHELNYTQNAFTMSNGTRL